jgi:VIT1/CCC1 family predicted Fe2+/Mn2+ transporter
MLRSDSDQRPTIREVVTRLDRLDQVEELDRVMKNSNEVIRSSVSTLGGLTGMPKHTLEDVDMLKELSQKGSIAVQEVEMDGMILQRRTRLLPLATSETDPEILAELLKSSPAHKLEKALEDMLLFLLAFEWKKFLVLLLPLTPFLLYSSPGILPVLFSWSFMMILLRWI